MSKSRITELTQNFRHIQGTKFRRIYKELCRPLKLEHTKIWFF